MALISLTVSSSGFSQTRLGAEISAGRTDLLIPYVADRTYLDHNYYALVADEAIGGGIGLSVRVILLTHLEAQLEYSQFERTNLVVTERSKSRVQPRRHRTDGTVDDAGVIYDPAPENDIVAINPVYAGSLSSISVTLGYRHTLWAYQTFSILASGGAGITYMTIPNTITSGTFGVKVYTGASVLYKFIDSLGAFLRFNFEGITTANYFNTEDASRVIHRRQGFTEQVIFDATVTTNVQAGLHYAFQ